MPSWLRYPPAVRSIRGIFSAAGVVLAATLLASPEKPAWPLTLRDGLPALLPGYAAAPRTRCRTRTRTRWDLYRGLPILPADRERDFDPSVPSRRPGLRPGEEPRGHSSQGRFPGVERFRGAREVKLGRFPAFAVTDRSGARPTTLVTVVVTPSRLVLGQGSNVDWEEALKLVRLVDFEKVAGAR